MFNNIIYFIIVLLIFSINHPEKVPKESFAVSLIMLFLTWLIFAAYCRWGFRGLQYRLKDPKMAHTHVTTQYHQLIARFSVLSVFMFAMAVYLLNIKYWIQMVPGAEQFFVLQGVLALMLFFIYLGTIWYFAFPVYKAIYTQEITRRSFVHSNFRLNLPILFPWMILSLVYDILAMTPWAQNNGFLNRVGGNIIFFSCFIILLMIYMPGIIQYWWGCKPLKLTEKTRELKEFLNDKRFKYRHLLSWPIFEGRMVTAGIMGIVPRYRYILITDALLDILSTEELKAVLAHEMGHAKYRHLVFYVLFFVGFMVISFGIQDFLPYLFYIHPFLIRIISGDDSKSANLFYLAMSIPMLIILIVYFRYVMGLFMRNFERQADLYSSKTMGSPEPAIRSLEKIAYFSGKIRDLPSWHHFSIRQRIDCLMKTIKDPGLIRRHNRYVALLFLIYLFCIVALGYFLNFSSSKQRMVYAAVEKALSEQLMETPDDIELYQGLAMLRHERGEYKKAIEAYEKVIELDEHHAASLNNLAWILVTAPEEELRDNARALDFAKRAVALERSSVFLDTLAEAYYANGLSDEAVETIKEAISLADKDRDYYERQLKKFLASERSND